MYATLTLRHLSGEPTDPEPRASMIVAVVLALTTVILIIAHLDHLARGAAGRAGGSSDRP